MQDSADLTEKEVKIDFVKVGSRIRKARKLRRMTQDNLASICNCSSNHLSAIENGTNKPSLEMKISIALDKNYFLMDSSHVSKAYLIDDQIIDRLSEPVGDEANIAMKKFWEVILLFDNEEERKGYEDYCVQSIDTILEKIRVKSKTLLIHEDLKQRVKCVRNKELHTAYILLQYLIEYRML